MMLLVHSKSKQPESRCFFCSKHIRTQQSREPSFVLDYMVHISSVEGPLTVLVLLLVLLYKFNFLQLGREGDPIVCMVGKGMNLQDSTPTVSPERNCET